MITHAIIKLRCKKETVESWQQSTRKGSHAFASSFSFSFILSLCCSSFFEDRSVAEWLLLGVATTNQNVVVSSRRCLMPVLSESTREPQENIWSLMNARVERRAPQNLVHLEQRLQEVWVELTIDDVAPF